MRLLSTFLIALFVPVSSAAAESVELFNGEDLSGWTYDLSGEAEMDEVWTVQEGGVLHCTGEPAGVLRTKEEYENYVLRLEWRWPEEPGNNGVLVHTSDPQLLGIWPKSLEVQLFHGAAGDFWVIGTEIDVEDEESRVEGRRHRRAVDDVEREPGEWNEIQITCSGAEVVVVINGQEVNRGENCTVTSGAICLQSEGARIEYRNVVLEPLP